MTAPNHRNPKLSVSDMLAVSLRKPKNLAEELVNLELMGHYPDDPASAQYHEAARLKWGQPTPTLRLAKPDEAPDFASRTRTQVRNARDLIRQDFDACVRMPWNALHEVIGHGLLPYQLWTIAAASGHGKTTFAMNLVKAWVETGKRVYVVPLEQPTDVMRVYLAALTLGFSTRLALANKWREMRADARDAIESELVRQEDEGELLHFSDVDFLTVSGLPKLLDEAKAFNADVIIIDHVHHIRGSGRNKYADFENICQTLHGFAKDARTPVVGMAQLNRGLVRDRVRAFLPPDVESIQGGDVLRQVSPVVMGLYRPLVDGVTRKDFARIRLGEPIKEFLKPNTVGVTVLKSRISGDTGDVVPLRYDRGHILDLEPGYAL